MNYTKKIKGNGIKIEGKSGDWDINNVVRIKFSPRAKIKNTQLGPTESHYAGFLGSVSF